MQNVHRYQGLHVFLFAEKTRIHDLPQHRSAAQVACRWNMCHLVTHAASCSYNHKSQGLDQWPVSHRRTAATQHNTINLLCFKIKARKRRNLNSLQSVTSNNSKDWSVQSSNTAECLWRRQMQSKHASHTGSLLLIPRRWMGDTQQPKQHQCSYSFTLKECDPAAHTLKCYLI